MISYDKVIIGAGFYGLYSAWICARDGQNVLVVEKDSSSFLHASYINQARIHMGYHYPRSISTAKRSSMYYERFCEEFDFCILDTFTQIYATSNRLSWTNEKDFRLFCDNAKIPCRITDVNRYFNPGMCDGAYETIECTYDAGILRDWLINQLNKFKNVKICFNCKPKRIIKKSNTWLFETNQFSVETPYILNATYAGVNEVLQCFREECYKPFRIKYEKCEIILCDVSEELKHIGITVMDGPFFSIMPFGRTGLHSLTSVTFTPHETSYDKFAHFPCQDTKTYSVTNCSSADLQNCNNCELKPNTAWPYMSQLTRNYLRKEFSFSYNKSLYTIKPILLESEVDDSRPTIIKIHCKNPTLVSVLSGKINTVYDLDEVLLNE